MVDAPMLDLKPSSRAILRPRHGQRPFGLCLKSFTWLASFQNSYFNTIAWARTYMTLESCH